jgi:hypothetical protein
VAGDWFESGSWDYHDTLPDELTDLERRTGFGVAHISYERISPEEVWGWNHVEIAHRIAWRFAGFVQDVDPHRVHPRFGEEATRENLAFRHHVDEGFYLVSPSPQPVGTPMHASAWIVGSAD